MAAWTLKKRCKPEVPSLAPPMAAPMAYEELFPSPNEIDWRALRDHLQREGRVIAEHALEIVRRMQELLRSAERQLGSGFRK